jgi:hypothetical protein
MQTDGIDVERSAAEPREKEIAALRQSLSGALAAYREAVTRLNPDLPVELINGETLEGVNDSLARARALVSRVRQGIEAEREKAKVPAGSSLRAGADISGLSAREKIQYGIGGK